MKPKKKVIQPARTREAREVVDALFADGLSALEISALTGHALPYLRCRKAWLDSKRAKTDAERLAQLQSLAKTFPDVQLGAAMVVLEHATPAANDAVEVVV